MLLNIRNCDDLFSFICAFCYFVDVSSWSTKNINNSNISVD